MGLIANNCVQFFDMMKKEGMMGWIKRRGLSVGWQEATAGGSNEYHQSPSQIPKEESQHPVCWASLQALSSRPGYVKFYSTCLIILYVPLYLFVAQVMRLVFLKFLERAPPLMFLKVPTGTFVVLAP